MAYVEREPAAECVSLRGPLPGAESWSADPGAVDLWLVPIVSVPEGALEMLPDDERERAAVQAGAGIEAFAATRVALRRILSRYVECAPGDLEFAYGAHGRPELVTGGPPDFNVSHSGELALIAVAPVGRVGVDIERVDSRRELRAIARRFFSPGEVATLAGLEGPALADAFFRLWTCKEAYLKALGASIAELSPSSFAIVLDGARVRLEEAAACEEWRFTVLDAPDGFAAALCWKGSARSLRAFREVAAGP